MLKYYNTIIGNEQELHKISNIIDMHNDYIRNMEHNQSDDYVMKNINRKKNKITELEKKYKELNEKNLDMINNFPGRVTENEINSTLEYYNSIDRKLPKYMRRNLKEMPNNKGYIHNDVRYYGETPSKPKDSIVLFEKKKNELIIHEWNHKYYMVHSKSGKEKRKTISKTPRRKNKDLNYSHKYK
jgi:hypothetical protein